MISKEEYQRRLGERVKELRKTKRLSQHGLAVACGKNAQSIGLVERGEFNASGYYLLELSEALGVTVSELLSCFPKHERKE